MKILALYLPQYHIIPENNEWWGDGYTEWNAVKSAKKISRYHFQPHIPLDNNYYDLSDKSGSVWQWQAKLANDYKVYGFCIYHYWFGSKQLLEKPMEILYEHKEIDIKYCICWANETWTRTWYDKSNEILIQQEYGDEEEWRRHYFYLAKFFKDPRYIKEKGMPLVNIYRQNDIDCLDDMLKLWTELAKKDGFPGLYVVCSKNSIGNGKLKSELINGQYSFEPGYSTRNGLSTYEKINYFLPIGLRHLFNKITKKGIVERVIDIRTINKRIIKNYLKDSKNEITKRYLGVCVRWDNTPRRGAKGTIYFNTSSEEFGKLLNKCKNYIKDDYVYLNAWNEWGEGCHLEPDELYKYKYLEEIKKVMEE